MKVLAELTIKLPPELARLGDRLGAAYQELAQIVWWDGFWRGCITGLVLAALASLIVALIRFPVNR